MSAEARLAQLGLVLPDPPTPAANYVTFVRTGNLGFLSGHGPVSAEGVLITGRVPDMVGVEDAYEAARRTGLSLLSTLRSELGSLDRVNRVVKLLGMVNATPEFAGHPEVINGCSDLLVGVFGDAGRHARSAVGVASLPFGMSVEIEAVVEVRD